MDRSKDSTTTITDTLGQNTDMLISQKYCCSYNKNLLTNRGQKSQLVKIITLATIPVVVLLIQSGVQISKDMSRIDIKKEVASNIAFSVEIGELVHNLQIERGTTALYLSTDREKDVYKVLKTKRIKTDSAIQSLTNWISLNFPQYFKTRELYHSRLQLYRGIFDHQNITVTDVMKFYSVDNDIILGWIWSLVVDTYSVSGVSWKPLVAYHMLLISREHTGIERTIGSLFYSEGTISTEDLLWFKEKNTLGQSFLEKSMQYSPIVKNEIVSRYKSNHLEEYLDRFRENILDNNTRYASFEAAVVWFDNMTAYIEILEKIQDKLAQEMISLLEGYISTLQRDLIINVVEMTGAFIMLPITIVFVYKLTKQLQILASSLRDKTIDIEKERRRSEHLLYQMLPISIAKRMMKKKAVIPEYYDAVTIYFSDIVGFTAICSRSTPMQVIHMLNLLYVMIDEKLEGFDVYKVETIGDAYMVASGLPVRNKDRHATEIALMSLEVIKTVSEAKVPHFPKENWKMRIGINTGPVVAGVVGTKMPRYCVFGDTVNVASRMESSGKPCMIQLSSSTKEKIDSIPEFLIRERGEMCIKGKGKMKTYWLLGYSNGHRVSTSNLFKSE